MSEEFEESIIAEDVVNDDPVAPLVPAVLEPAAIPGRLITVEPPVLLLAIAVLLTSPVDTTLYLTHTCRHLGFNETTCSQLEGSASKEVETVVQGAANKWVLTHTLVEAFVPAVLTVFAGPWSDRRGRRTFMLLPILGYAGKYAILVTLSHWPTLAPYWLVLAAVPASLGGGFLLALSMCFCYVSDVSTPHRRGLRMGLVQAAFYGGVLAGTLASTHLFGAGGYLASYATAGGLCVVGASYTAFLLPESVRNPQIDGWLLSGLADWRLVASMLSTCYQRRPAHDRAVLWLTIAALGLAMLPVYGEHGVGFLFARRKFGWDIKNYTTMSASSIVMQIFCSLCGVGLLSLCQRPNDAALAMAAFAPKACACVLMALSPYSWWMYMAVAIGSLGALRGPLCRAVVSKRVAAHDVGKALSLVSALEAIAPLAAAPLYTLFYNKTLVTFPGAFFLLSAGIFAVDSLLLGVVLCLQDKSSPTERAPENTG